MELTEDGEEGVKAAEDGAREDGVAEDVDG